MITIDTINGKLNDNFYSNPENNILNSDETLLNATLSFYDDVLSAQINYIQKIYSLGDLTRQKCISDKLNVCSRLIQSKINQDLQLKKQQSIREKNIDRLKNGSLNKIIDSEEYSKKSESEQIKQFDSLDSKLDFIQQSYKKIIVPADKDSLMNTFKYLFCFTINY